MKCVHPIDCSHHGLNWHCIRRWSRNCMIYWTYKSLKSNLKIHIASDNPLGKKFIFTFTIHCMSTYWIACIFRFKTETIFVVILVAHREKFASIYQLNPGFWCLNPSYGIIRGRRSWKASILILYLSPQYCVHSS